MKHYNDELDEQTTAAQHGDLVTSTGASRLAFSPDEAAELLGVSRELVFDLLRTGQLRSVKAGRRRLISRAHLDAFLAGDAA